MESKSPPSRQGSFSGASVPQGPARGPEDKQAPPSWLEAVVDEARNQPDPVSLDLVEMAVRADIQVARSTPPPSPEPGPMQDGLDAAEDFPAEIDIGQVCKVALCTCCRDAAAQAAGQGLGMVFMSLLSAPAVKVVGPLCCVCGSALSLTGCVLAYKGLRGKDPRYANWGTCLALTTGFAFGAAALGAGAIQLTAGNVHSAQLTAAFMQSAIAVVRNLTRDTLVNLLAKCTGTVVVTDQSSVNRGLTHPSMARTEAARLWGACLCYLVIYATLLGWGQGAIAESIGAEKLSKVLEEGGSFDDRMLALAPGAIGGVIGEAADGCANPLCAALAALVCGNKVVVERGMGPLNALAYNVRNKKALWETAVAACKNGAMRYTMGNVVRDLTFVASIPVDNGFLDGFVHEVTSNQALALAMSTTEWRGALVAAYGRLVAAGPKRERMDGDADTKAPATVFASELGAFQEVPADSLALHRIEHKGGLDEAAVVNPKGDSRENQVELIKSCLAPGATFQIKLSGGRRVECRVNAINVDKREVAIGSRRPLGGDWVCEPVENEPDYPYQKTGNIQAVAELLQARGLEYHDIDMVTDEFAMQKGMFRAESLRGADGKEDIRIERVGERFKVGGEVGSLPDIAGRLVKQGRTIRDLKLPAGETEFPVSSPMIATTGHLRSLLNKTGSKFTLMSKDPGQRAEIRCNVTFHGTETSQPLPGLTSERFGREPMGDGRVRYRANNDDFAAWLFENFSIREDRWLSTQPILGGAHGDIKGAPVSAVSKPMRREAASRLRPGNEVTIGGHKCIVDWIRPRVGTIVLRSDGKEPIKLLEEQGRSWKSTTRFPKLFGPLVVWRYEIAPAELATILEAEIQRQEPVAEVAPARRNKVAAGLVDGAKAAVEERLLPAFGAQRSRDGKRPGISGNEPGRDYNQAVLSTVNRMLDRQSFLHARNWPEGSVSSLFDLNGFDDDIVETFKGTFTLVEQALSSSDGLPDAPVVSKDERDERGRAKALAALMPADQQKGFPNRFADLVGSYLVPDSVRRNMADAAVVLAAGFPANSPQRRAAAEITEHARSRGESDGDLRPMVESLRGNFDDPLRQQAWAYLEHAIATYFTPA